MNAKADYFAHYEAIAAVSARMLAAARKALWNELIELQEEYRVLVDMLRDIDASISLDEDERVRKYDLIRRILADDAAIRDLANPSVARLSAFFSARRPAHVLKELFGAR
ncbi:flagellar protein FliT [Trinickia caryophylli]|uniref:Flagellar protein FliT n=1 Tax=Trinickia caryophylli TaxID=28094 RepID=A0A1X7FHQ2_TRICW|nr:flagellar protein FliT [Trinickia caryophylli]PMS13250.1 flagellar protein FliT [Trinickia caryophylli]TRX19224.1 flagellar protein FliT [Trinickia caryophylli]WQE13477.1 flagellar protein FliT [Trinickia caryophylli]SMF52182.1 flagellar protein FliT [Trinickia caryophylli]GLU33996.1 flagellar protein FliT [Trinickia caryophylli]